MSLVEMRGISKHFGATVALDGVDLFLEPGEVHALVGENGSGKSTLMRILAGALPPDIGDMKMDGNAFHPTDPLAARKSGVAMIYQELALCPDLTVAENILLGMESTFIHPGQSRAKAKAALAQLGHSDLDPDQLLRKLPLALCQIVEIARAVATGSRVLILDEPTSSLSEPDVIKLFEVIRSLRESGHAVVYISHFLDEIERIADRITILRDGQLVATKFPGELSRDQIVSLMVGRTIDDAFPRSPHQVSELILDLRNVSGEIKPQEASLQLHRGEVVGIAGLNGSGRS
ncbi:MAG TPA: ATP-binding cassette domain-containing protein [Fimbriimonas sp.]|nr:ATP-binding cassette domain-containing protein [Fimbriimonas sp.]